MKGIVAEINGKYAVVLTQTGSFKRVKASHDMAIGKEIDISSLTENGKIARSVIKITSLAATGLLALGVGLGAYSYTLPYSYIHVDINPSIELTVNMYDRIIGAEALNIEGEELLSQNDLKNEKVNTGVARLLNTAVQQGYLNSSSVPADYVPARSMPDEPEELNEPDELNELNAVEDKPETTSDSSAAVEPKASQIANAVLVTVSSNNAKKSVDLEKKLTDAVSVELDRDQVKSEILVAKTSVEQRNDARRFGVTPGKLMLIEGAMEGKSGSEMDELKKATIKDLLEMATNKEVDKEKQAEEQREKSEKQNTEDRNETKMNSTEEKTGQQNEKKAEEAERKAEEAAKRKEEEKAKADEARKRKEEAERKKEEDKKKKEDAVEKAAKEHNKSQSKASKKQNNSREQDRKNDQFEAWGQDNNDREKVARNQESKWNTGKKTGEDLKKERERLMDELLNQMNNGKKDQDKKYSGQNNQQRNNK